MREGKGKPESFPFLRLPKELRLLCYEFMSVKTSHYMLTEDNGVSYGFKKAQAPGGSITLIVKSIPAIGILATCRLIYDEAHRIFRDNLVRHTPRIVTDSKTLRVLPGDRGVLKQAVEWDSFLKSSKGRDVQVQDVQPEYFARSLGRMLFDISECVAEEKEKEGTIRLQVSNIQRRNPFDLQEDHAQRCIEIAIGRHPDHDGITDYHFAQAIAYFTKPMVRLGIEHQVCFRLRLLERNLPDCPQKRSDFERGVAAGIMHANRAAGLGFASCYWNVESQGSHIEETEWEQFWEING